MASCVVKTRAVVMLNEEKITPKMHKNEDEVVIESSIWYLDNGASNHMTGQKNKFLMKTLWDK